MEFRILCLWLKIDLFLVSIKLWWINWTILSIIQVQMNVTTVLIFIYFFVFVAIIIFAHIRYWIIFYFLFGCSPIFYSHLLLTPRWIFPLHMYWLQFRIIMEARAKSSSSPLASKIPKAFLSPLISQIPHHYQNFHFYPN